jgi:ABC-type dipeptide/oligopeptide/nickel transport system permease subunit
MGFRNLFNYLFVFISFIIMFIIFWPEINPEGKFPDYNDRCNYKVTKHHQFQCGWISPVFPDIPLGRDGNGNDYLMKLSLSYRYDLKLAILATIIFLISGLIFGISAGFYGITFFNKKSFIIKSITNVISQIATIFIDFFQTMPLILVLFITRIFFDIPEISPDNRLLYSMYVVAVFGSIKIAIPITTIIKKLHKQEFILASKASGLSIPKIIGKHILYYESRLLIIAELMNFVLFIILAEVLMTYFGYGTANFSLGTLLVEYYNFYNIDFILSSNNNPHHYQVILTALSPVIFLIILCLHVRWLGGRIMVLTD